MRQALVKYTELGWLVRRLALLATRGKNSKFRIWKLFQKCFKKRSNSSSRRTPKLSARWFCAGPCAVCSFDVQLVSFVQFTSLFASSLITTLTYTFSSTQHQPEPPATSTSRHLLGGSNYIISFGISKSGHICTKYVRILFRRPDDDNDCDDDDKWILSYLVVLTTTGLFSRW